MDVVYGQLKVIQHVNTLTVNTTAGILADFECAVAVSRFSKKTFTGINYTVIVRGSVNRALKCNVLISNQNYLRVVCV